MGAKSSGINTKGQTYFVNPMVKGLHFANKALTPEEFKRIAEQIRRHGLQMIDEEAPYLYLSTSENALIFWT